MTLGNSNGAGRFAWLGGTLTTPSITINYGGTLAIGFDFNVASLLDASLFHGSSFTSYQNTSLYEPRTTLEITNGATASQMSGNAAFSELNVGSYLGSGTYILGGTAGLTSLYESIGEYKAGSFIQSGGTNTITQSLYWRIERLLYAEWRAINDLL